MKKSNSILNSTLLSLILLVLIIGFTATYLKEYSDSTEIIMEGDKEYHNFLDLIVNGEAVRLEMDNGNGIVQFQTLNVENDISVLINGNDNFEVTFDGVLRTLGEEFDYRISKLNPDYNIPVIVRNVNNDEVKVFQMKTWPDNLPQYRTVGKAIDGAYYITTYGAGVANAAYKVNQNGELLYYRVSNIHTIWDFKKVNTDDGIRYLQFEQISTQYASNGYGTAGEYIVFDEKYHEINRLRMVSSEKISNDNWPVDQHDILYINDSEYYLMSYVNKFVTNVPDTLQSKNMATLVVSDIIQGFRDGKMFFEWDSMDYPELYEESVEYNDYMNSSNMPADYAHLNSMDLDRTNNALLCSFRDLDSVMKIDLKTGKILWKLGGKGDYFNLSDEQKLSKQHYARYNANGSITVFDNGNMNLQTRVAEFWLDEEKHIVKDFKSYQIDGYWSVATGSSQRLSDTKDIFAIGWGTRVGDNLEHFPSLSEVDFSEGNTLFALYFLDSSIQTYRCAKY